MYHSQDIFEYIITNLLKPRGHLTLNTHTQLGVMWCQTKTKKLQLNCKLLKT